MKKTAFLALILSFTATSVFAGGSKAPATPSKFAGQFSELVSGDRLIIEDERFNCPSTLTVQYRNDNEAGTESIRVSGDQHLFTFENINNGRETSGMNFSEAFTDSKSLKYVEGFQYFDNTNPTPGRPGGGGPELVTVIEFSMRLKLDQDTISISTNSYRSNCVYKK